MVCTCVAVVYVYLGADVAYLCCYYTHTHTHTQVLERALEVWEWMVQSHVDACHDAAQWQQIVEVFVCERERERERERQRESTLALDYWYGWYTNASVHTVHA